jgi:hypothetical protein
MEDVTGDCGGNEIISNFFRMIVRDSTVRM